MQVFSARSEEYRLLFRLPPDEVLVQDFNCALQENILLQGHMYLFVHHICFYSNIFGFETKKTIPFHEVTCVRKAKTAAIFPNAIEIAAAGKKHFFGSFLSRDEAYRLIVDGWAQHVGDVRSTLYSQDLKSETCIEDIANALAEKERGSKEFADDLSSSGRKRDVDSGDCIHLPTEKADSSLSENKVGPSNTKEENAEGHSGHVSSQCEDIVPPKVPETFTMVAQAKFSVSVEEFFTLFISDQAFDFLDSFHKRCGDKDFNCSSWRQNEQLVYVRDMSFLHPVKIYLGAKYGRCHELQKYHAYNKRRSLEEFMIRAERTRSKERGSHTSTLDARKGQRRHEFVEHGSHLVIETSQQITDVPYADYFLVEGIWEVQQNVNEESSCIVHVYSNVSFSKKTIFRGKIEQSTIDECREVYRIWIENARELLKQRAGKQEDPSALDLCTFQDSDVRSHISEPEGASGMLHQVASTDMQQNETHGNFKSLIETVVHGSSWSCYGLSTIRETWVSSVSYLKSDVHLPLVLIVIGLASMLILMQMSIFVLLTRVPEVQLVTRGTTIGNFENYGEEYVEWLEKRFKYLKEDVLMVESRLEAMRHEHALLKTHLLNLERVKKHKP
ncbi:hypothetical protein KSP39_PZI001180 [Platanthera zijinensis]|uniref:VASt domain-containing protein n=1 Tax=Platanthera zijinensis TaxID=2320716 RepID=A0AAP0GFD6_9ASPA